MRLLPLACCMALFGVWQSRAQQAAEAKPKENQAPAYAGSEVCQACHEDLFNAIKKSPHGSVESDKKRGWVAVGITTPKMKIQVYVTKTGRTRVYINGLEMVTSK